VDERERRVTENEVLFRKVNEQIVEVRDALLPEDRNLRILCEYGVQDCDERIDVDADEYRRVRDDPSWFGLRPEHVIPDLEDVVADHEGWVVVEKREPVKSALEGADSKT
jgi:hypothetical protein